MILDPNCAPVFNIAPPPCGRDSGGGGSPGAPVEVAGCCSPSMATTLLCTPDCDPVTLVLQSTCVECGDEAGNPRVTGWVDAAGTFTAGAPPAGIGPCGDCGERDEPCATVTTIRLCDITPDGECVPFLRHMVHDCDGQVTNTADTNLLGEPYTPVGQVDGCDNCPCVDDTKVLVLCDHLDDGTVVRFVRRITYDCDTGQITAQEDLQLDMTTPYEPQGRVGNCCDDHEPGPVPCDPQPVCARFSGVAGPDVWELPEGVESLSVSIICGEGITVTDCAGEQTVMNEGCGTISWAAPQSGSCTPNTLCRPFTVELPEGAAAYFSWIETDCGGEES